MRFGPSILAVILVLASCSSSDDSGAATTSTSPGAATTGPSSPSAETTATPATSLDITTTTTTTAAPTTTTTTTTPDTTPPALAVTDPAAGASVTTRAYRFSGTTEPGASVVAAGRYAADVTAGGAWSIVLMLNPGGNVATFVATDAAGNTTEVRVPVYLQACVGTPEVMMATGATDTRTLTADLDGDGASDTITTYLAGGTWRVHVELAYGWETETDITPHVTNAPPPSPARIVHIGVQAVVVDLGGNLVGSSYGFVAFAGCTLRTVLGEGGEPPDTWIGIGIPHAEFFRCEQGAVTQVEMGRGEISISVTETRYPFSGATLSFGAPKVTTEQIAAPAIPTDGSPDTAWENEVATRRASACVP